MERIAILDHFANRLYIEDIPRKLLLEEYGDSEEDYIKDNYKFEGAWSWEYITEIEYIPDDNDPIVLEPKDLL